MAVVWSVLLVVLKWMAAHPAEMALLIGFLASLVEKYVAGVPFLSKLVSAAAQVGLNGPGLVKALVKKEPAVIAAVEAAVEQKAGK